MAFLRHPERNEADLRAFMHCSSGSSCLHYGLLSALLGKGRKAFKTLPDFRPEWKGMRQAMRADANDDEAKFPGVRDELIRATFKGDCGHWRAKMMKVPCASRQGPKCRPWRSRRKLGTIPGPTLK